MSGSLTTHAGVLERELGKAFPEAPVTVASAYLFASEVEGRAHSESDVDVGVLLPPIMPGGAPATAKEIFEQRVALTSWLIGICIGMTSTSSS